MALFVHCSRNCCFTGGSTCTGLSLWYWTLTETWLYEVGVSPSVVCGYVLPGLPIYWQVGLCPQPP